MADEGDQEKVSTNRLETTTLPKPDKTFPPFKKQVPAYMRPDYLHEGSEGEGPYIDATSENSNVIHAESKFKRPEDLEPAVSEERRTELGKMGMELGKVDILAEEGLVETCLRTQPEERPYIIEGCADQMAYKACGVDPEEQVTPESPKKLEVISQLRLDFFDFFTTLVNHAEEARREVEQKV